MKAILVFSILFSVIALPALSELTDADLNKIRLIVKEEVTAELSNELEPIKGDITEIKKDISTLKEGVARLDGRLSGIEKQVAHATNVTYGLIALIVVAIGIPAWYGSTVGGIETKIEKSNNSHKKSKC